MRDKCYKIEKGTNDGDLRFAWQLTCNGRHVQWFSDEIIARRTCDELNSKELLKDNNKEQYDMSEKVYVVTQGEYSDYHIEAVFKSKEEAAHFCATNNVADFDRYGSPYEIEEYDIGKIETHNKTPHKRVIAHFRSYDHGKTIEYHDIFSYITYRNLPDKATMSSPENVTILNKDGNMIHYNGKTKQQNEIIDYKLMFDTDINKSRNQIEKMAEDRMAQWQAEREGI
jgi:hypothetical protein